MAEKPVNEHQCIDALHARKLETLNRMTHSWCEKFETPPPTSFQFSVDERDRLLINDIVICDIDDVKEACAYYDLESFYFESESHNGYYRIKIIWDYDDNLYVSEISLVLYEPRK